MEPGTDIERTERTSLGLATFVQETRREIAKVTWPTRKETMQTTFMIVVMALIAAVFFLVVDWFLGFIVGHILGISL